MNNFTERPNYTYGPICSDRLLTIDDKRVRIMDKPQRLTATGERQHFVAPGWLGGEYVAPDGKSIEGQDSLFWLPEALIARVYRFRRVRSKPELELIYPVGPIINRQMVLLRRGEWAIVKDEPIARWRSRETFSLKHSPTGHHEGPVFLSAQVAIDTLKACDRDLNLLDWSEYGRDTFENLSIFNPMPFMDGDGESRLYQRVGVLRHNLKRQHLAWCDNNPENAGF